jgi:hypothetical protein
MNSFVGHERTGGNKEIEKKKTKKKKKVVLV